MVLIPSIASFSATLPPVLARSLDLAHIKGLFAELPFPDSDNHPPTMFSDAITDNTILDPPHKQYYSCLPLPISLPVQCLPALLPSLPAPPVPPPSR